MSDQISTGERDGEGFTRRFLSRLPPELAASFAPEQLAAVQREFGTRYRVQHAVDIRRTVSLPWDRFYLVVLLGREARRAIRPSLFRLLLDTACLGAITLFGAAAVFGLGVFATWLLPAGDLMLASN